MSRQDDSIAILNSLVKVRIAPSKIHGVGVFAMRLIPKGTKLYTDMFPQAYKIPYGSFGKLFPEVGELLLERWPNIVNGSSFMYPDTKIKAYINHGQGERENYDAINDIVIKDIESEDEILEDYRLISGYEKVFTWLVDKKRVDKKNVV